MTDSQSILLLSHIITIKTLDIDDYKEISMWNVYNLLTGANKVVISTTFWTSLNASHLTEGICNALHGDKEYAWFID